MAALCRIPPHGISGAVADGRKQELEMPQAGDRRDTYDSIKC